MPDFVDSADFLAKSSALRRHGIKRDFFDPTNPAHIASMKHYMETGNWLQQFFPEDPYIDVPMTVFRKYAGYQLGILVTTSQKLDAEMVTKKAIDLVKPRKAKDIQNEVAQKRA